MVCNVRQHLQCANSSGLPIRGDCILILMSHFLHILRYSAILGLFLFQMLHNKVLPQLHRIQADDKLLQRPVSPSLHHKLFPIYHCTAVQYDQKMMNLQHLLSELLIVMKQEDGRVKSALAQKGTFSRHEIRRQISFCRRVGKVPPSHPSFIRQEVTWTHLTLNGKKCLLTDGVVLKLKCNF